MFLKKQPKKNQIIAAIVGLLTGGILTTLIGKYLLDFGIALLTGIAVIGSGFMIGTLTFGKKLVRR